MSPRQHALLERLENDPGFMQALYEKALVPEDIPSMGKPFSQIISHYSKDLESHIELN